MLDEEQGRGNGLILRLESDDMAVEEGLQVIVTMVFQTFLGKDGIYISKGLESSTTGLIIDYANLFLSIQGCDAVQTVDQTAKCGGKGVAANSYLIIHPDIFFETQNGERRQATVDFKELSDVFDDDFTIDNLQTIERRQLAGRIFDLEEFLFESLIDGTLDVYFCLKQILYVFGHNQTALLLQLLVDELSCQMEDISKDAVVDVVFIIIVVFDDAAHLAIEELQLTAHIAVDGRWRQKILFKPFP